jgi:hypothetical protein
MTARSWVLVGGVASSLAGVFVGVLGIVLVAVVGSDGTVRSGDERLSVSSRALVVSLDKLDGISQVTRVTGTPRLRIDVRGMGADVFVGIGPAARVEAYLAGAGIDRVGDFQLDPFTLRTSRRGGAATPAPPGEQDFWTARVQGRTVSVEWTLDDRDDRLVLMRSDAGLGVGSSGRFALSVPRAFPIGVTLIAVGAVLLAAGIVLVVRRPRQLSPQRPTLVTSDFP